MQSSVELLECLKLQYFNVILLSLAPGKPPFSLKQQKFFLRLTLAGATRAISYSLYSKDQDISITLGLVKNAESWVLPRTESFIVHMLKFGGSSCVEQRALIWEL